MKARHERAFKLLVPGFQIQALFLHDRTAKLPEHGRVFAALDIERSFQNSALRQRRPFSQARYHRVGHKAVFAGNYNVLRSVLDESNIASALS